MDEHLEPLLRELVGAVLREERRRQGRTLAQVSETAGISMQHLSDVERGRKDASSEMLAAITGALGLSVTQVLMRVADGDLLTAGAPRRGVTLELSSAPRRGTRLVLRDEEVGASLSPRSGLTLLSAA
jgi:transcriptional regulator with XRE-family HTH domain